MNIQSLQESKNQVLELAAACQTLDTFFAEGAVQLDREDQVKRLRKMAIMIKLDIEKAESSENSARITAQTVDSGGEIAKIIISPVMGKGRDAFDKTTAARNVGRQHCFGNIMVRVGKGGLPDDVQVVCISERAREQNRPESSIILEIRKSGTLLFTPDSFMQMVEGAIRDIRKGKLRLPMLPSHLIARTVPINFKPLTIKRINV
jgi:hypothetical protein